MATTTITKNTTYSEKHALLFIKGSHNSNYTQNGIVAIDVVGNNNAGQVGTYNAKFMTATDTLDVSNFYIEYINGSASADGYANFWIRANTNNYASWRVKILQNSGWTIASANPTATTLPTSGYTGKNSVGYQRATAQIVYARQTQSIGTAWSGKALTTTSETSTTGSGLTISSGAIKINNSLIKKIRITASFEALRNTSNSDTGARILKNGSNFIDVTYGSYNSTYQYWQPRK